MLQHVEHAVLAGGERFLAAYLDEHRRCYLMRPTYQKSGTVVEIGGAASLPEGRVGFAHKAWAELDLNRCADYKVFRRPIDRRLTNWIV